MNGAECLFETLTAAGLEVCFANPGTSEMHLVHAIGKSERMRAVLCLFEGVASGAADGYARMTDRPALTLLHVGSGFANSMANQHNARRAQVPLVNLVGDHADYHLQYDAPLTSDLPGYARAASDFLRISRSADDLAQAGAETVQASLRGAGRVATCIAPANHAWEPAEAVAQPLPASGLEAADPAAIRSAVDRLRDGRATLLFLGGRALRAGALAQAGRIAEQTGARLVCQVFPTRLQRGTGRVAPERLPYFAEAAMAALAGTEQMLLVGAKAPVSFFAYPGKPSVPTPAGCEIDTLATVDQDAESALRAVADALGAPPVPTRVTPPARVPLPNGPLTPQAIGQSVARHLPADAVVVDEANTCGLGIYLESAAAAPHDWLTLTGGAIGDGLPLSLGAAIACPKSKVLALQADGSAMYTLQALWSLVRERADVTVVIMNNRSYAILNIESARVGAGRPTPKALSMLDLSNPYLDFVALASGMGMDAARADTAERFDALLAEAMATPGPRLIEAMVAQQLPGG